MPAAAPRWARRSCDRTRRQRPDETTAPVSWVRRIWADSQPNQPVCREHVGWAKAPCTPRTFNAKTAAPCPPYGVTMVVIRWGTSPTGMTAFTFMLAVSMAVTDLIAALEI